MKKTNEEKFRRIQPQHFEPPGEEPSGSSGSGYKCEMKMDTVAASADPGHPMDFTLLDEGHEGTEKMIDDAWLEMGRKGHKTARSRKVTRKGRPKISPKSKVQVVIVAIIAFCVYVVISWVTETFLIDIMFGKSLIVPESRFSQMVPDLVHGVVAENKYLILPESVSSGESNMVTIPDVAKYNSQIAILYGIITSDDKEYDYIMPIQRIPLTSSYIVRKTSCIIIVEKRLTNPWLPRFDMRQFPGFCITSVEFDVREGTASGYLLPNIGMIVAGMIIGPGLVAIGYMNKRSKQK